MNLAISGSDYNHRAGSFEYILKYIPFSASVFVTLYEILAEVIPIFFDDDCHYYIYIRLGCLSLP